VRVLAATPSSIPPVAVWQHAPSGTGVTAAPLDLRSVRSANGAERLL
jgi:hypothetical protein